MPKAIRKMPENLPTQDVLDRFWNKVDSDSESPCWIWTDALYDGYGVFRYLDQNWRAHRFSYWIVRGAEELDKNEAIHHMCENKKCVNPLHLKPCSNAENLRHYGLTLTHCVNGHPFNEENTYIRKSGKRQCRACARDLDRARYKEKYAKEKAKKPNTPERKANKLTEEQRCELVRLYQEEGLTYAELSRRYGISSPGVRYLVKSRT